LSFLCDESSDKKIKVQLVQVVRDIMSCFDEVKSSDELKDLVEESTPKLIVVLDFLLTKKDDELSNNLVQRSFIETVVDSIESSSD